ncbi:unnamed protein product [Cochlearia groenlandica]
MYANDHSSFLSSKQSEPENEEYKDTNLPQDQLKYLYSAVNRISSEQSEVKKQLTTIERFMARIDTKLFVEDTKGKDELIHLLHIIR